MNVLGIIRKYILLVLGMVVMGCAEPKEAPLENDLNSDTALNRLSEAFLAQAREGKDTQAFRKVLAEISADSISEVLITDTQRYAFWVNIYNAFILDILGKHPEYYNDRDHFFTNPQIEIGGETIAFAKIEHGILRRSQWELGFGYMGKWFPGTFERKLRVKKRDYRIHFALNCGAKDCPPVAVYQVKTLQEQLELGTRLFLKKSSKYNASEHKIKVSALFNWFRGDFGGKKGIRAILEKYGLVGHTEGLALEYASYDWTLDLKNHIDLDEVRLR